MDKYDKLVYQYEDQNGNPSGKFGFNLEYSHYKCLYNTEKVKNDLLLKQLYKYEQTNYTPDEILKMAQEIQCWAMAVVKNCNVDLVNEITTDVIKFRNKE